MKHLALYRCRWRRWWRGRVEVIPTMVAKINLGESIDSGTDNRMKIKFKSALALSISSLLVAVMSLPTMAQTRNVAKGDDLPEITCDRTSCSPVKDVVRYGSPVTPQVAIPMPVDYAPPAGQRLLWQGAGYPACQSVVGITDLNPYEYIKGVSIDVPLGATHASVSTTLEALIAGGPTGAGGIFGLVEMRPTGGTWQIVSHGYAAMALGSNPPYSQYSPASYMALVDLAGLNGGTVPSQIDVRLAVYVNNASGFTAKYFSVCKGQLLLTF